MNETKIRLREAAIKLLTEYNMDDITLKMFESVSGFSKQTLYNHYENFIDILYEIYEEDLAQKISSVNIDAGWLSGFHNLLKSFPNNRKFFLHFYYSSFRDDFMNMIQHYGQTLIEKDIDAQLAGKHLVLEKQDREFIINFYTHIFCEVINIYFQSKLTQDPDYLFSRCEVMLRHHIPFALNNIKALYDGTF